MDINTLRDDIDSWEPVKWEGLPDIDLYMDQVVTYLILLPNINSSIIHKEVI